MKPANQSKVGGNLIFLISQPRAGSTMFQLMLSGSREIATAAEPWIALHPIFASIEHGEDSVYNSRLAREALGQFLAASGTDFTFYNKQVAAFLQSLYDRFASHHGGKYFLDKTPRYYYIIEQLIDIFPAAKFILLFRNPLAVLNSILNTWVKDDLSFLCNFIDDLILAPQKLVDFAKKYPDVCHTVHYENVVNDPEPVLRQTCEYLQIEYTDQMIGYSDRLNKEWKLGDQEGVFQFNRPSSESLFKWKEGFRSDREIRIAHSFLSSLGPRLIKEMGYDYQELEAGIPQLENCSPSDLISWETIMHVVNGISDIKNVRRAAFQAIASEKFSGCPDNSDNEWDQWVQKVVMRIICPEIDRLNQEKKQLKLNIDHLNARNTALKDRIAAMEKTLSWKITSPLRNSKILKRLLDAYRSVRH